MQRVNKQFLKVLVTLRVRFFANFASPFFAIQAHCTTVVLHVSEFKLVLKTACRFTVSQDV